MNFYLTIRDNGEGITKAVIATQKPSDLVFPIDIAGPLSTPPILSTVIQSDAAVSHNNEMSVDAIAERVEQVRKEKLIRFNQALDRYGPERSNSRVHLLMPSSVMLCGKSSWEFIYPELVSSLLVACSPGRVFIDIGANGAPPLERVMQVISLYRKLTAVDSSMDGMLLRAHDVIDVTVPPQFGLVCSVPQVKEMVEWIGDKEGIFVAPFISPDAELLPILSELKANVQGKVEVIPVIASMRSEDKEMAHEHFGRYKMKPMFWSPYACDGIDLKKKYYETIPVEMKFVGTVWERPNRNAKVIDTLDPGQKLDIRKLERPGDIGWAEIIDKKDGRQIGYMIWSYQGQEKVTFL